MLPWPISISYQVLAAFWGCCFRWPVHDCLPFWEPWSSIQQLPSQTPVSVVSTARASPHRHVASCPADSDLWVSWTFLKSWHNLTSYMDASIWVPCLCHPFLRWPGLKLARSSLIRTSSKLCVLLFPMPSISKPDYEFGWERREDAGCSECPLMVCIQEDITVNGESRTLLWVELCPQNR